MAVTPFDLPLTITKGVTYGPVVFHFKQEDGSPFDLTVGGTWKCLAYARRTKDAKQFIDLNPIITNAVGGEATVEFTDEQTTAMMGGMYGWDMILEVPTGERIGPYFSGKLSVEEINTHT